MLPPKQYLPMYQKFGLIPETELPLQIPSSVLAIAIYAVIIPLIKNNHPECTALAVRRKQGIFSMNVKYSDHKTK